MWTSYSARHAAQLIGLPESAVRSCIRDGLVGTPGAVPAQLSFRDLAALRTVKALVEAGVPLPRVRKDLVQIQSQLPTGTTLAELTVEARDGRVHVRGTPSADARQLALALEPPPLVRRPPASCANYLGLPDAPVPVAVPPATADQWLSRAQLLEERDSVAAIDAYRRLAALAPRLHRGVDQPRPAVRGVERCRRRARDCFSMRSTSIPPRPPRSTTSACSHRTPATRPTRSQLTRKALALDPQLAEAHYNLATLFDQSGDFAPAIGISTNTAS